MFSRSLLLAIAIIAITTNSALSDPYDSRTNREAIISQRAKRFFKANSSRQYISANGNYSSDYNSKTYNLNSRYLYQSNNSIHEINFEHETNYADKGSGSSKEYYVKDSELYDLSAASKLRISDSKNYAVLFHRSIYDEYSSYYYDSRNAVGLGRMFFNEKLELDFSLGYQDIKTYGYKVDFITSIRSNFKITKNLTLTQRGYIFLDHESMDNELKTSLIYRIANDLSFEIRNNFEQRRYESTNNTTKNYVSRSVTIGLIFDLN